MRLVCPNCGAQYEVDDKVIPDSGRDVQCSACGHAWYQRPAGQPDDDDLAADPPLEAPVATEADAPGAQPEADAEAAPEDDHDDEGDDGEVHDSDDDDHEADDEADDEAAPAAAAGARRIVDDGVRDILKEEAEREIAAREREGRHAPEQVETQGELGIGRGQDPDEERRRLARERMARMRGIDIDEDADDIHIPAQADAPDAPTARRDLFPDIEEINSTLDSRDSPADERIAGTPEERRGGFGRGFMLVVVLAAIAAAVYLFAPQIAARIPATETALGAYVETVDKGRLWLEENTQALIGKLEDMAAPDAGTGGSGE
jgi:predicted Zn finger-like uncharacterized protein